MSWLLRTFSRILDVTQRPAVTQSVYFNVTKLLGGGTLSKALTRQHVEEVTG